MLVHHIATLYLLIMSYIHPSVSTHLTHLLYVPHSDRPGSLWLNLLTHPFPARTPWRPQWCHQRRLRHRVHPRHRRRVCRAGKGPSEISPRVTGKGGVGRTKNRRASLLCVGAGEWTERISWGVKTQSQTWAVLFLFCSLFPPPCPAPFWRAHIRSLQFVLRVFP